MNKFTIPISGMHCKSCEINIEENLKEVAHVAKCQVSHVSEKAKIWYHSTKPSMNEVRKAVEAAGYEVREPTKKTWFSRDLRTYFHIGNAALILAFLYILAKYTGVGNLANIATGQSISAALIIGLVAGVSSCMALIGGLVLGLSARHAETHPESTGLQKFRPHIFFNLGRIIGFAVLGGLIGVIGSALQPSVFTLNVLTIVVAGVMILLGLKLMEVFPILDRVNLTLPKSISKILGIKTNVTEYSHRSAFAGGVMSFFLPCGFTQAMQLFAISTGSFTKGAMIMSLFALGTSAGLLGVGGLTSAFKGKARLFFATAGLAVVLMGIYNITNASRVVFPRSNGTVEAKAETETQSKGLAEQPVSSKKVQVLNTVFYLKPDIVPSEFTVKAGQPVRMVVDVKEDGSGCMSTIMIPGLYDKPILLKAGQEVVMEFTPQKKGKYYITCAMGVPRGLLTII